MIKVIGVSGKIGSGKSTFCDYVIKEVRSRGGQCEIKNFADKLKQITFLLTGKLSYTQDEKNVYLEEWGMTVGEALQKIGTEAMRNNFHPEVWVISALTGLQEDVVYLIGDVRFPNEVEAIKARGGITVRLEGDPAKIRENSKRDLNHLSETALDNYKKFDFIYKNDKGLEELKNFSKKIVEDFCY